MNGFKSFSVNDIAGKHKSMLEKKRDHVLLYRQILEALQSGAKNFVLAYNIRAGIGVALRLFVLVKSNRLREATHLPTLLGEGQLKFRVDAVSLGLFVGWFSGGYKALYSILCYLRNEEGGWNSFTSGAVAATAVLFLDRPRRRVLALYLLVRALQCMYNGAKTREIWHFWGSSWRYGDAVLFALSSAQVMYAYAMRPATLPPSYYQFIVRTGPVRQKVLEFLRINLRGGSIDPSAVNSVLQQCGSSYVFPSNPRPDKLSCRIIHADSNSCLEAPFYAFSKACRTAFPLYLSLHIVPTVVLRLKRFISSPFSTLSKSLMGATRSTIFLGTFVSLYQVVICSGRKMFAKDNKYWYYIAGLLCSSAILIEEKSRRAELALYVLPRAADSIFMILQDRRRLSSIPGGDVLLFCISMGTIMYCYQNERNNVSPALYRILRRFIHPGDYKKDA